MRAKLTLLVGAVVLTLSLVGAVQTVAAAPAQHISGTDCFEGFDWQTGGVITYCYTTEGVLKETEASSGNIKIVFNGTQFYTATLNGVVVYSSTVNIHQSVLGKQDAVFTYHIHGNATIFSDGTTCTYTLNTTFANGEVRHEKTNEVCG